MRCQPAGIIAYASALGMLACEARAGRLRIAPRRILSTSEPLFPEMRRRGRRGVPRAGLEYLRTSEAGPVAIGCW